MLASYDFQSAERKWYESWMSQGMFKPRGESNQTYTIMIPPPNVTGILHIGHVLNNTLQDILIRYKRMQGYKTLWVPGTDHAGIATQNKVEQLLAQQGLTKEQLGRVGFLQKAWEWKEKHGGIIIQQLKKLGCSCDWDRERFTMDPGLSRAVREVFVRLFDKNLIYKGQYIVNQCPRCRTAISDEEVEHRTTNGKLWYVRYPLMDEPGDICVATTRPETMLGDVAVAVHPEDIRYKHLIGKMVILPLQNRPIPIIADEMVDREFGTGAVKITPAHDANDFEAGKRHHLTPILVIDDTGTMTEAAGTPYRGMDRFECRHAVVDNLKSAGLLVKIDDYQSGMGYCYRCNTVVEPFLSEQWFVRMKPLAQPAIRAVEDKQVTFYPERWTKVYLHWMENIRDWCISRQLWWGHRIPVWTCVDCHHVQAYLDDPHVCPTCSGSHLVQDPDVMDTWFSSWLWPFSTLGWPDNTEDLKTYYPTQSLITAPEIIFFWVSRMIMAGLEFMGRVPFEKVYLHGTVRDNTGRKMSKSYGNSPDPLDIIDEVGSDALRFSMIMISPRGSDILFSEDSLNVGRNFSNKIWNAAKLILSHCPDRQRLSRFPEDCHLTIPDKWIIYRLAVAADEIKNHLEEFRFNDAAIAVHRFIWHEFCDWYLEIAKPILYGKTSHQHQEIVHQILVKCFTDSLQLLHPFMPFITEEIWHSLFDNADSIMVTPIDDNSSCLALKDDADQAEVVFRVITAIRTMRAEMQIGPSVEIEATISTATPTFQHLLSFMKPQIMFMCRLSRLEIQIEAIPPEIRATFVTSDNIDVFLNLEGIVDVPAEIARLEKEIRKVDNELIKINQKLSNEDFLKKAPQEILDKNKRISEELTTKKDKLRHALSILGS